MNLHLAIKPGEHPGRIADDVSRILVELGHEISLTSEGTEMILSVGGDGSLLHNIFHHLEKDALFAGVNAGSLGFLCYAHPKNLKEDLARLFTAKPFLFSTFEVKVGKITRTAVQEVRIERASHSALRLTILNQGEVLSNTHVGDGVIVTGSLGSTGYNHSAGGPILPIGSPDILLTPICPFLPEASVFDSLPGSLTLSEINLQIIPHTEARLVLDNRAFAIPANVPVRIRLGDRQFRLIPGRAK